MRLHTKDELVVLHREYNVKVEFKTYSDALVARLSLQLTWKLEDIDLLLDIIHNPGFDRNDLTFRKATDIEDVVGERRNERAEHYSSKGMAMTGCMPDLVFELALNNIREELDSNEGFVGFPDRIDASLRSGIPDTLNTRQLLKNISLVHRSWTKPVQDILRSRVYLNKPSSLARLLQSIGSGTRVYELQDWRKEYRSISIATEEEIDPETTTRALYRRLAGLRALSVSVGRPDSPNDFCPLDAFPPGFMLKALHVHGIWTCESLTKLCAAIMNLTRLSVLSVIGQSYWDDNNASDYNLPDYFSSKCPPSSLTQMFISYYCTGGRTLPVNILTWLLQPRDDYALRELRFSVQEDNVEPLALSTLTASLSCALGPSLETLALRLRMKMPIEDITELLHPCTSLKHLHLQVMDLHEKIFPQLPPSISLKSLHISDVRDGLRVVGERTGLWMVALINDGGLPKCEIHIPRSAMKNITAKMLKVAQEQHGFTVHEDAGLKWTWQRSY